MFTIDEIQTTAEILAAAGGFVAMCGYAYGRFTEGKTEASDDSMKSQSEAIQLRQNQITELRDLVRDLTFKMEAQAKLHNDEMRALHTQLGEVKGQLLEKEKQNKDYLAILQNRSPELEQVLVEIKNFMRSINDHMVEESKVLKIESTVSRTA